MFSFRRHIILFVFCFFAATGILAQSITDAPDYNAYYKRDLRNKQKSIIYQHVRENDVIWETLIWRTINIKEKFNQYFYYPLEPKGVQGRKNFAYMIWDAVVANEIPIYEDDEFKILLDNDDYVKRYTRPDTLELEIIDENEEYEYKTIVVPKEFNSEDILNIKLKEVVYQEKQTAGQYVRTIGLALVRDMYKEIDGEREYQGTVTLFWIPMLSERVQNLFAQREAYYEDNIAHLPSWEYIFYVRMFSSYITRESNRFNRTIDSYLTGEDALLESERIEQKLFEINVDQWEM